MDKNFFIKNLWRWASGVSECDTPNSKRHRYCDLAESEWSPEFETLMRNRLIMGGLRYGLLKCCGKPQYNRVDSIKARAELYEKTGNTEYLVDIANLALLEFEEGEHPNKHFSSVDDGEHVKEKE